LPRHRVTWSWLATTEAAGARQKKLPAWLRDAIMKQETDKAKEKRKQLSDTSETKKAKMPSYTKFDGDSDAQSTESETEEPEPDLGTASAPQPELDDATRTLLVRTIFTEVLLDVTKQLTQLVATQVLVAAVAKTQAAKATSAAAPKKEAEKRPLGGAYLLWLGCRRGLVRCALEFDNQSCPASLVCVFFCACGCGWRRAGWIRVLIRRRVGSK